MTSAFRKLWTASVGSWIAFLALAISSTPGVVARDFRVNMLPNGATFSCLNCHTTSFGGARNAFGRDVEQFVSPGGRQAFWSSVFSLDSDGDGFTNGEELGDPDGDGVRTVGARATNPGSATSKPAAVNKAPTVTLSTSIPGPFVAREGGLKITAAAADSDGTVQQVEFFVNDASVSVDTTSPFEHTLDLTTLADGNISLKAIARDNSNATTTSSVVLVRVRGPLRMNTPAVLADGSVDLTWPSVPGSKFILEASEDLETWVEVASTTVDGPLGKLNRPGASQGPSRFYRAREVE